MKVFECDECNKKFTRKANLTYHKNSETACKNIDYSAPVTESYECMLCSKNYTKKSALSRHLKNKHNTSLRAVRRMSDDERGELIESTTSKRVKDTSLDDVKPIAETEKYECTGNVIFEKGTIPDNELDLYETGTNDPFKNTYVSINDVYKQAPVGAEKAHLVLKDYTCPLCEQSFTRNSSLKRHLQLKRCKNINGDDNQLVKRNQPQQITQNNIVGNHDMVVMGNNNDYSQNENIQNNQINNMILMDHTKEGYDTMPNFIYQHCFGKGMESVKELTRLVNFNANHPERQNICLNNIYSKFIEVFIDGKWQKADRDQFLRDLYNDRAYVLIEKYNELCDLDEVNENRRLKFDRFVDVYENDKEAFLKRQCDDIKLFIHNNSDVVKKNIKKRRKAKQIK